MDKETQQDLVSSQEFLDLSRQDISSTLEGALSKISEGNVKGSRKYLSGLKENLEGALGWIKTQNSKATRTVIITSVLFGLATSSCNPIISAVDTVFSNPDQQVAEQTYIPEVNLSEVTKTPKVEPTQVVESYKEKLTDGFKKDTEELFGETSLQEVDGVWSLVDKEGRQTAGFIEGKWWINYSLVGPRSIPSWDQPDYLCRDEVENSCGKLDLTYLSEYEVEDFPFPQNFENNPFVKKEMESIERKLTDEMKVPLGNISELENTPSYKGNIDIILGMVSLGKDSNFKWTILPLMKDITFPQWPVPVWLVVEDEKGSINNNFPYFYKINDNAENICFKDNSLKTIFASTPIFDNNFSKSDSRQHLWRSIMGIIVSNTTDEFLNNQKWTLIPYGDKGDILLVYTSQNKIYQVLRPDNGNLLWTRKMP